MTEAGEAWGGPTGSLPALDSDATVAEAGLLPRGGAAGGLSRHLEESSQQSPSSSGTRQPGNTANGGGAACS